MKLIRKELKKIFLENEITKKYSINLIEDCVDFQLDIDYLSIQFDFRLQFDSLLTLQTFTISLKEFESKFKHLIISSLNSYYEEFILVNPRKFYPTDHSFSKDIQSKEELDEFLSDFYLCLNFYETEIFPKLTDIRFLADYVGSVPFENALEIVVGGTYPVTFFKKLAILKWGNHPRYEEYKQGLATFIEEDFLDPKYQQEAPSYKKGFEKLIYHLENEPNPFL
ncbi:hypothetical protein [Capnocytophaga canimorsus]|uniref:hypothetical protein n=1 Tax=Capnocytophaga canimorsus TaxID=28188 RepID=UPI0037D8ACF2